MTPTQTPSCAQYSFYQTMLNIVLRKSHRSFMLLASCPKYRPPPARPPTKVSTRRPVNDCTRSFLLRPCFTSNVQSDLGLETTLTTNNMQPVNRLGMVPLLASRHNRKLTMILRTFSGCTARCEIDYRRQITKRATRICRAEH